MRRSSEEDPDGVAVALAEHLCMYCAGAGLIAFALYYAMQPTRVANPGLAAYKPPPRTVMTYTVPLTFEREATTPAAAASEPETVGAAGPQLPEAKKAKPQVKEQVKAQRPPRARPVRQQQPEHPANFAYQPSFGEYRPMY
jgi:hypothetical protein